MSPVFETGNNGRDKPKAAAGEASRSDAFGESMSVFDKVEAITAMLKKEILTNAERGRVQIFLEEINDEMKKREGKVESFFRDDVMKRLKALFPKNPIVAEMAKGGGMADKVDLLVDGKEAFQRIIENIRTAKTIYINIFLWRDDKTGNEVARELLKAADRGAKITIVKDAVGGVFEYAEK